MFRWRWSRRATDQEGTDAPGAVPTTDNALPASVEEATSTDPHALDAFVQVLRGFGQYAFDLDHEPVLTFSQQCMAWARHLSILTPSPLEAGALDGDGERVPKNHQRDWPTVVQFILARRKREQQHVNKALGDLRQSIWTFAQNLGVALVEDQQTDGRLKAEIDRLKVAVERLSPEELKAEVVATASNLSSLVSERQQTQQRRLEALGARVTELTGQLHEAQEESARDSLTHLTNRKGLDEFLNRMVFLRDVLAESACLLMVDVDHFKTVNDTYGHPGGDVVLRALADCLIRNFPRRSDLVARYGGEEFAVVLSAASVQDAKRLAERLLVAIRALRVRCGDQVIAVTASVGVGRLGKSESIQSWLERTDQALYRAKAAGRDTVVEAVAAD